MFQPLPILFPVFYSPRNNISPTASPNKNVSFFSHSEGVSSTDQISGNISCEIDHPADLPLRLPAESSWTQLGSIHLFIVLGRLCDLSWSWIFFVLFFSFISSSSFFLCLFLFFLFSIPIRYVLSSRFCLETTAASPIPPSPLPSFPFFSPTLPHLSPVTLSSSLYQHPSSSLPFSPPSPTSPSFPSTVLYPLPSPCPPPSPFSIRRHV